VEDFKCRRILLYIISITLLRSKNKNKKRVAQLQTGGKSKDWSTSEGFGIELGLMVHSIFSGSNMVQFSFWRIIPQTFPGIILELS